MKPSIIFKSAFIFFLLTFVFQKDPLGLVDRDIYDYYSEGIVACSMLRSVDGKPQEKLGLGLYPPPIQCYEKLQDSAKNTLFSLDDAFNLTDSSWEKGIARTYAGFFVENTASNLKRYMPGTRLRLKDGSIRAIPRIELGSTYINVYLDGPPLSHKLLDPSIPHIITPIDSGYSVYTSQLGVPGYLFGALYKLTGIQDMQMYRLVNSAIFAAILTALITFVLLEFGTASALAICALVVVSPWLLAISNNLYWVTWAWYLPLLVVGYFFSRESKDFASRNTTALILLYFVVVAVKAASGYEYLSTILLASMVPVVYFGIKAGASVRSIMWQQTKIGLTGCAAFLVVLCLHANLRADSFADGIKGIISDVARRTYASGDAVSATLGNGASVLDVLGKYFGVFLHPIIVLVDRPFYQLLVPPVLAALCLIASKGIKEKAIGWAFLFSITAPVSWFVLAKGHSFAHIHINPVLWDVPTLPLGALCLALLARNWLVAAKHHATLLNFPSVRNQVPPRNPTPADTDQVIGIPQ